MSDRCAEQPGWCLDPGPYNPIFEAIGGGEGSDALRNFTNMPSLGPFQLVNRTMPAALFQGGWVSEWMGTSHLGVFVAENAVSHPFAAETRQMLATRVDPDPAPSAGAGPVYRIYMEMDTSSVLRSADAASGLDVLAEVHGWVVGLSTVPPGGFDPTDPATATRGVTRPLTGGFRQTYDRDLDGTLRNTTLILTGNVRYFPPAPSDYVYALPSCPSPPAAAEAEARGARRARFSGMG